MSGTTTRAARGGGWSREDIPDLSGTVAIVTGANTGIGLPTARTLVARGARVVMACRNEAKAQAARGRVLSATGVPQDRVRVLPLDLASQASVTAFAERFLGEYDRLDLLINNAGLGSTRQTPTEDGFELQFGVNHLGHMALTLRLLPALVRTAGSRVVTLSSGAHRFGTVRLDDPHFRDGGYRPFAAYSQSKLANLLFAAELARRLTAAGHGTLSVAVDPGVARTELGHKQVSAGTRVLARLGSLVTLGRTGEGGSLVTLRAATDPHARTGDFYAPRWGGWGTPMVTAPAPRGRDRQVAARLWEISLRMLGQQEPAVLTPRPAKR
ncbi:oxidoreductase [Allostreptomyces psammosilenae]|uniref:NAD(P)-dependent dehydrogenase (Short-subunit alcohol dehydrogenase family) n=1 Tax=Allostreptomyces psammosilenae TaxID=1892865 RepID=A0A853A019_9ACTN|nr:oxidoreductase [Allostreptomyces psammosilenae]NYI07715.1 NAD(P)-dependent dehydrogenase (short-subunit alcohol dehydrogenase family) [Allostreptomyces psammosilenae]